MVGLRLYSAKVTRVIQTQQSQHETGTVHTLIMYLRNNGEVEITVHDYELSLREGAPCNSSRINSPGFLKEQASELLTIMQYSRGPTRSPTALEEHYWP